MAHVFREHGRPVVMTHTYSKGRERARHERARMCALRVIALFGPQ